MQDFVYKTLGLVRISVLISDITKSFWVIFLVKLFYKSNRKLFSCVCIAWYKHSRGWENSRQLCKPSTSSLVCITVLNSPSPSRLYIRLCKHRKRFLLLNYFRKSFKEPFKQQFLTEDSVHYQPLINKIVVSFKLNSNPRFKQSTRIYINLSSLTVVDKTLTPIND